MKELFRMVALDKGMANLAGRSRNSPRYSILKRGEVLFWRQVSCLFDGFDRFPAGLSRAVFHS